MEPIKINYPGIGIIESLKMDLKAILLPKDFEVVMRKIPKDAENWSTAMNIMIKTKEEALALQPLSILSE